MGRRTYIAWKHVSYLPRMAILLGLSVAFGRGQPDMVSRPRTYMTSEEFERLRDNEAAAP